MATATVESLLKSGHYQPSEIACCSAADGTAQRLSQDTGISLIDLNAIDSFSTDTLVLACKPQQLPQISEKVVGATQNALVISILAGTRLATLSSRFANARNVVRVMPNTPGSIGEGMSGFTPEVSLDSGDRERVVHILETLGEILQVEEKELDGITAISGSGPAYLFLFVEGLYRAALNRGFDEATAMRLAKQTVIGSAKLLEHSGQDPEDLRIQVTSPGGTTQAAIESFQSNGFTQIIDTAVKAAYDRSIELGEM